MELIERLEQIATRRGSPSGMMPANFTLDGENIYTVQDTCREAAALLRERDELRAVLEKIRDDASSSIDDDHIWMDARTTLGAFIDMAMAGSFPTPPCAEPAERAAPTGTIYNRLEPGVDPQNSLFVPHQWPADLSAAISLKRLADAAEAIARVWSPGPADSLSAEPAPSDGEVPTGGPKDFRCGWDARWAPNPPAECAWCAGDVCTGHRPVQCPVRAAETAPPPEVVTCHYDPATGACRGERAGPMTEPEMAAHGIAPRFRQTTGPR